MTYLSSHLSILFSYVANSVPDFWTHSCIFQPPDDSWGGRVRNWHRPSDVLTFASCDTLWVLFFVCVWKRIYANVSIGGKIYNILPLGLSFFSFHLTCVWISPDDLSGLSHLYIPLRNMWMTGPGQASPALCIEQQLFLYLCVCVGCFCVFPNRAIRFSLWNNRPSALAAAGVYPFITKAFCISFQELWMERRRRKKN